MQEVSVSIDQSIRQRHPDMVVRGFVAHNLRAAMAELTVPPEDEMRQSLRKHLPSDDALVKDEKISAWRDAVASCGLKPSRYRSSVEALARRVLKGQEIRTPLRMVDLYCSVSVMHLAPLGAYDLDRLPTGSMALRCANPTRDSFAPLGGDATSMPLTDRVAVYAIGNQVLCYAYNHRDSRDVCLVPETDNAMFLGEAVTDLQARALDIALDDLKDRLRMSGAVLGSEVRGEP